MKYLIFDNGFNVIRFGVVTQLNIISMDEYQDYYVSYELLLGWSRGILISINPLSLR